MLRAQYLENGWTSFQGTTNRKWYGLSNHMTDDVMIPEGAVTQYSRLS